LAAISRISEVATLFSQDQVFLIPWTKAAKRKAEQRKMAQSRIAAIEQKAIVEIERSCLNAQAELAIAGD
jgi:hypothetical protein